MKRFSDSSASKRGSSRTWASCGRRSYDSGFLSESRQRKHSLKSPFTSLAELHRIIAAPRNALKSGGAVLARHTSLGKRGEQQGIGPRPVFILGITAEGDATRTRLPSYCERCSSLRRFASAASNCLRAAISGLFWGSDTSSIMSSFAKYCPFSSMGRYRQKNERVHCVSASPRGVKAAATCARPSAKSPPGE
jgi:hypothetical protein